MKVPFVNLAAQYNKYENEILPAIQKVACSGQYILGQNVKKFELKLADHLKVKHVISVASGTDALSLTLKAWQIGSGDEVITVPNSFIASAGAIASTGARIKFIDVDDDFNLDTNLIENSITNRTKAIMPVHLTGNPCDMNVINSLATKYNLKVIEDAEQAIDANYKNKKVGGLGDAGAFSLHPLKNFNVMGDAGFISTNDNKLASSLLNFRNHGLTGRDESYFWAENSRLDELQAAIGLAKLPFLPSITKRFRDIASYYKNNLESVVKCPLSREDDEPVYHNFVIQVSQRDYLIKKLLELGIETKIHYPIPLHLMKASCKLGYKLGDFPKCEQQSKQILSLPIYSELTDLQIELVVKAVKSCVI